MKPTIHGVIQLVLFPPHGLPPSWHWLRLIWNSLFGLFTIHVNICWNDGICVMFFKVTYNNLILRPGKLHPSFANPLHSKIQCNLSFSHLLCVLTFREINKKQFFRVKNPLCKQIQLYVPLPPSHKRCETLIIILQENIPYPQLKFGTK